MVNILGIECCDVLKAAVCPVIALALLEIVWNAAPGASGLFWAIKIGILGYAGYTWVNGDPIKAKLLGGD